MRIILALAIAAVALSPTAAWSAGTLDKDMTLEHDGLTRYFDSYVPDGLPDSPVPLLFVLHPGGADNGFIRRSAAGEFMSLADQELFIVLYPNATTNATEETGPFGRFAWNHCGPKINNPQTVDDVGFVNALIDWAAASHNIDLERVYATGASSGGYMSYRLAFELSDRIAAIGALLATKRVVSVSKCPDPPANPLAVLIMLGTADPLTPWEGGPKGLSGHETRDFWRTFLGTDEIPTHVDVPDINPNDDSTVEIDVYSNGAEGSAVAFYTVNGGGHRYPSIAHDDLLSLERFGPQNRDIEYTAEIWNFLENPPLGDCRCTRALAFGPGRDGPGKPCGSGASTQNAIKGASTMRANTPLDSESMAQIGAWEAPHHGGSIHALRRPRHTLPVVVGEPRVRCRAGAHSLGRHGRHLCLDPHWPVRLLPHGIQRCFDSEPNLRDGSAAQDGGLVCWARSPLRSTTISPSATRYVPYIPSLNRIAVRCSG